MSEQLQQQVGEFLSRDLRVIPLQERGKKPTVAWAEYQRRPPTMTELEQWFSNGSRLNVGIVTGEASGVVAIDCDSPAAIAWADAHLPATPMVTRTAKGEHRFFRHPGTPVRNKARVQTGDTRIALDIRGDGGFVVAPGSTHESGVVYEKVGTWPDVNTLPVFDPQWVAPPERQESALAVAPPSSPVSIDRDRLLKRARAYIAAVPPAVQGDRGDEHTFQLACKLVRGFGLDEWEAVDLMREWNHACVPPWTERELEEKVQGASKYGSEPVGGRALVPPPLIGPTRPVTGGVGPGSQIVVEPPSRSDLSTAPSPGLPGLLDIRAAITAFQQRLERGDADRLPFGLSRVDRAARGIEPGELAILLGRTASLKTMWLLNWIRLLVKHSPDKAILLVEMEMPCEQLIRRLLRMELNRTDAQLDAGLKAGEFGLELFENKYRNLHILDKGAVSLGMIERYAGDLARSLGDTQLESIFIDHAGLLKSETGSAGSYDRASAAAIGLKQLARSLSVAVFCVVQANRAGNKTDGEPVNLEAARDSGCYEENADFVLAFSKMTMPAGGQPFVKMRLAKNRRGPEVPLTVGFDPHSLKMAERDEIHHE